MGIYHNNILLSTFYRPHFSMDSFSSLFLSITNGVSTGPTCQLVSVCVFSGLLFKVSDWLIYSFLTVILAPYLSLLVF